MHAEIKEEAGNLAGEARKVFKAIAEHNIYLEELENKTQKVENKSQRLKQKLLWTMKEIRKDGRNTVIITLTLTLLLLLFYLL